MRAEDDSHEETMRDGDPQAIGKVLPMPAQHAGTWNITADMRAQRCARCGGVGTLHQDPDSPRDPRRTVCGKCCGQTNRRIVDGFNAGARSPTARARKAGFE